MGGRGGGWHRRWKGCYIFHSFFSFFLSSPLLFRHGMPVSLFKTKLKNPEKVGKFAPSATQNTSDQKALPCWGVHLICRFPHRERGAHFFQLKGPAASLLRFTSSDTPLKHPGEGGDQTFQVGRNAVWCCSQCLQALALRLLDPICSEQQHIASNHRGIFREWAMCAGIRESGQMPERMDGWMTAGMCDCQIVECAQAEKI